MRYIARLNGFGDPDPGADLREAHQLFGMKERLHVECSAASDLVREFWRSNLGSHRSRKGHGPWPPTKQRPQSGVIQITATNADLICRIFKCRPNWSLYVLPAPGGPTRFIQNVGGSNGSFKLSSTKNIVICGICHLDERFFVFLSAVLGIRWGKHIGLGHGPGGRVVPNANVTIKELKTGISHQTHTNANGYYTFPVLPGDIMSWMSMHPDFALPPRGHCA